MQNLGLSFHKYDLHLQADKKEKKNHLLIFSEDKRKQL